MKAIVIGLGSMGRRRARLLKSIDPSILIVGVDTQKERQEQARDELGIEIRDSIEDACVDYEPDIAFISTSPLSHAAIITQCLDHDLHVFTELNLVSDKYEENLNLSKQKGKVLFLSSTFLYRKEIEYIKRSVKQSECRFSYVYHAGQYLPDWHPWESYKNFFVGDKRTNGCREFMAIEFPWIIDTFGKVSDYHVVKSRNSNLEIDFPDTYHMTFEHERGHIGLIQIDVVSRKAARNLEISGEDIYLTWGGNPDSLYQYDIDIKKEKKINCYEKYEQRKGYSSFIIEDAYKCEIMNFLDVVNGDASPRYSFVKDKEVLKLINAIEGN